MASTKDVDQLLRSIAHIDGVEIRSNGKPHHHIFFKGKFVTTLPKTPSDSRWHPNAVATLRRAGITPSTKPQVREIQEAPMIPIDDLRARVSKIKPATFAKFLVNDVPVVDPNLWTYKNENSAAVAIAAFRKGGGLTAKAHQLMDSGIRLWEQLEARGYRPDAFSEPPEPMPEPELNGKHDSPALTLRIRLSDVVELGKRFGVEIELVQ